METLSYSIASLRSRMRREEGFTLIEFSVAIGVLFIALLALVQTATVAFTDIGLARQRQTANQLANQLLEEVRGMPYVTLEKGLADGDLGGDANIVTCSGEYYFQVCPPDPDAERIIHTPGLPDASPLVPHQGEFGPPDYPSTFSWSVYVTEAQDVPLEGAYRVTAIVTWARSVRRGVRNSVDAQTLVYSPEGCVDTLSHPFGAPCQPYFFVTASAGGGGVATTGQVEDLSFNSFGIALMRQAADIQVEQITRVTGAMNLPDARRVVSGDLTSTGASDTSAADSDPSTPAGAYDTSTAGPQAPASLVEANNDNELAVTLDGSDQGQTISTTAAGGGNSCNLQTDGRACGFGTGTAAGAGSHTLTLEDDVGTATLMSVAASGTPATTFVKRLAPLPDEDGLVRGEVTWSLPEIRIGGLPSGMDAPPMWLGYWARLTGFEATATAEAGTGSTAPAVTISGGQIESWNGTGYTTVPVSAAGGDVPVTSVNYTDEVDDDDIQVEIDGTVQVEPSTTGETISGGSTRTEGQATIGSPLVARFTYRVSRGNNVVADLDIQVNAGRGVVSAVYQPAPTP